MGARCFAIILGISIVSSPALAWEMTETPKPKADNGTRSTYAGRDLRPEIYFVPFPDEEAVVIGEGIDLISGRRKPIRCVTMTPAERITFNNKDALFSEVTDEESLWEKLNMSISARASYAGYSGGAKYSSSVETTTSSKKISIVVQSALKTYAMMLPSPPNSGDKKIDLTDYARRLAAQPVLFRQICGDGFISQVTYGADLYGVFDFHSLSYEQKKKTTAAVDAAGPGSVFKVDADMSFESAYKTLKTNTRVQTIERGGGPGEFAIDRDGLIESFKSLPERAKDNERPIFLTVLRYSTLPGGRDKRYLEVVGNLEAMIRRALRLKTLINDYNAARIERIQKPNDPEFVQIDEIEAGDRTPAQQQQIRQDLLDQLSKLQKKIADCIDKTNRENCTNTFSEDDDLYLRAVAPLPTNSFEPTILNGMRDQARTGVGPFVKAVQCEVAEGASLHLILRVDKVRCDRDNKCASNETLTRAIDRAYSGYGVTVQECAAHNFAPALDAKTKDITTKQRNENQFWRTAFDRNLSRQYRAQLLERSLSASISGTK